MNRPYKGVVTGMRRGFMLVKLESRATIAIRPVEGISRGDSVEMLYDFTHNRVVDVWKKGQMPKTAPKEPDLEEETLEAEAKAKAEEHLLVATFFCPFSEELGEGEGEDEEEGAFLPGFR